MQVSKKNSENWLNPVKILAKVVLLTFIMMIVMGISSGIAGLGTEGLVEDASQIMGATIFVCFLQTAAISYPIIHSKLNNWQLAFLMAGVFFGIQTFLVQIETLIFLDYFTGIIDPSMIPQLFIQGAITSIIFVPIAVLILRGRNNLGLTGPHTNKMGMSKIQAMVKFAVLAVVFVFFYVIFGMFVAWQNPALVEYYGDLIAQMAEVGGLMLLLQAGRSVLFTVIALPVIHTTDVKTWKKGLAIALLFSILTSSNLLIPTSIMPESVRISHFIEVAVPGFVFGLLVVWFMYRSHHSIWDLFRGTTEDNQKVDDSYLTSVPTVN